MSRMLILILMISLAACAGKSPATARLHGLKRTGSVMTGEASWYGKTFNGKKTANGERFNQNELTAAHRKLPFNTWLEVTNLENNKSVVVRINDRGPYVRKRMMDLSFAAAKELDMVGKGYSPIRAEILDH